MTDPNDRTVSSPSEGKGPRIERIGHFQLLRLIGSGGQGEVYEALDLQLHRRVALKLLTRRMDYLEDAERDRVRARFIREAEVAARLDHPGICAVYESGEEEGTPWIAMRLVEGESLARLIAATRDATTSAAHASVTMRVSDSEATVALGEDTIAEAGSENLPEPGSVTSDRGQSRGPARDEIRAVIRIIESAAGALQVAHDAGLVHRDIKPGNLIVTPAGEAVILDFGLASDRREDAQTLTQSGDLLGTPAYMSPEQLRAERIRIDQRTDVYSLGVTLFECLCLKRPFEGPSREAMFREILSRDAPDIRRLNPKVPLDLAIVCACALEKNPDRRYQSARAFAEDLRRVRENEPIRARPVSAATKVARWAQRNPVVASLLGAILVFLSVGIVWATIKNRELAGLNRDLEQKSREASEARDRAEDESRRRGIALEREQKALVEKARALSDYERLADQKRLEVALREADALYPPSPQLVSEFEDWQARHGALATRLEGHRAFLAELRGRGEKKGEVWSFESATDEFQHDLLATLVTDLEAFATSEDGALKSIARRLDLSRRIEAETIADHAERWRACRERVLASERYAGLDLAPQLGLVPVGPDPDSGLEEFLHWLSHEGELPARDAEGRIVPGEKTGLVLVLIPGGSFLMGAQTDDPEAPNHDPYAIDDPGRVHEVKLEPYLLSKYEMTQAQWSRCFREQPSQYGIGVSHPAMKAPVSALHPVERVSWDRAVRLLPRLGLTLPTEAEWERAARAGTQDIWAGTSEREKIRDYANMNGVELKPLTLPNMLDWHEDEFLIHAPVGSLLPNAFGLHDMSGNVAEWCYDGGSFQYTDQAGKRGLRGLPAASHTRIVRGGSWAGDFGRVSYRVVLAPANDGNDVGIRPARLLDS